MSVSLLGEEITQKNRISNAHVTNKSFRNDKFIHVFKKTTQSVDIKKGKIVIIEYVWEQIFYALVYTCVPFLIFVVDNLFVL